MANEPEDTRVPEPEPPHEPLCSSHQRVLQFYCQICKIPVCQTCTIRDHKEAKGKHELIEASEAFNNFRVTANDLMLKANVHKKQAEVGMSKCIANASDLINSKDCIKKQIYETVEEMVTLVREIGKELDLKLIDVCERKEKKIKAQIDELKSTVLDNEEKQNYITKLLKSNEATALKTCHEAILALQQRIKVLPEIEPRDDGKVYFSSSKDLTLESLQKHGIGGISEKPNENIFEIVSKSPIIATCDRTFHVEIDQRYECEIDINDLKISTEKVTPSSKPLTKDTFQITRIVGSQAKFLIEGSLSSSSTLDVKFCNSSIKGSPIEVIVQPVGIVKSIKNIGQSTCITMNDHKGIQDLVMLENFCFVVVCIPRYVLFKFENSGAFITRIGLPEMSNVKICKLKNNKEVFCVTGINNSRGYSFCTNFEIYFLGQDGHVIKSMTFFEAYVIGEMYGADLVYLADKKENCVCVYDLDNRNLKTFGSWGNLEENMNSPSDVALSKEGNLVVADTDNHRVQLFGSDGQFIKILIGGGNADGMVIKPSRVGVDDEGNIIVASESKVQLFDNQGKFLRVIHETKSKTHFVFSIISHYPRQLAVAEFQSIAIDVINY